jgi:hypothetical protein
VSNPSNLYTLNNVTVTDAQVNGCLPSLGTPVTIAPEETQTYVCANNVISETTQNTAVATGEYTIENTATASAPEDATGEISSTVGATIAVSAQAQVTVYTEQQLLFLPIILK